MNKHLHQAFSKLAQQIEGEIHWDHTYQLLFSTDASPYQEMPLGVCFPKNKADITNLVHFAKEQAITLIPRGAGTSLAGQVVGNGLVVDCSKYMTRILEFNKEEQWIRVEPGVVPDQLNRFLKQHGLMFGPETSTANRCTLGGMLGNNSCGLHSLVYGSTRDHTKSITALLSNGEEVCFQELTPSAFELKCKKNTLEGDLYRQIQSMLGDKEQQELIRNSFPKASIPRRNTGYALDLLLDNAVFSKSQAPFNFCRLLAGSEGTLAFITSIQLNLVPLPPAHTGLVCVHCHSLEESLQGNLIALQHKPQAIELMDKTILDLTKGNLEQNRNRFFLEGDPAAILIVELVAHSEKELKEAQGKLEAALRNKHIGYHYPMVTGSDTRRVWELRKAGLGVLSNLKGDAKPVSVIEDTSVSPEDLPAFIQDFNKILKQYDLSCVYHAHIATGELHLRPILNLKKKEDVIRFRTIATAVAHLVKKYRGSLSGEHGDGRLRGEFIPFMLGDAIYELLRQVKETWDPGYIFNRGKIIKCPPMDQSLRFNTSHTAETPATYFDFSASADYLRASEKCNGSGDCLKMSEAGGTMCPSYRATKDERLGTRGRANMLRETLQGFQTKKDWENKALYKSLSLCLSCKACLSECPSNVDIARLKAEFLQHYYDTHGIPLRSRLFSGIASIQRMGAIFPALYNKLTKHLITRKFLFPLLGISSQRALPQLQQQTVNKWFHTFCLSQQSSHPKKHIYLFNDEFTNYSDTEIGIQCIQLLNKLGYAVTIPRHVESGRASLSKGMVKKAKKIARQNIEKLYPLLNENTPLVGIEPSAILTFRDEYPDLADEAYKEKARHIAEHVFTFEEFLVREWESGLISTADFSAEEKTIYLHGHCHQKALTTTLPTRQALSIPANYLVKEIPSGCCGMAGSFGYEKEHYELSMQIGEMTLFPAIRALDHSVQVAAPGTSCRQQIKDGTGIQAFHPIEILWQAVIK